MQLNTKLIPLVVTSTVTLHAASSEEVSLRQMRYQENDDRISINYTLLDVKKDFGTDYSLSVSASYDQISGGSPVWDSISGASSVQTSDEHSGASPCVNEQGEYICKDTRDMGVIGDGTLDTSDYAYRNVEIEDTRKAITANLTKRTTRRDEITLGGAYSQEEDFRSVELSGSYLFNLDQSRNSSITAGISYQSNSAYHYLDDAWKDFDIINFQIGYTHTFTKYTVGQVNYFYIRQSGVLSNPYQTIIRYFNVANEGEDPYYKYFRSKEKRPDEKNSAGITTDLVSKIHPDLSWHLEYRFYKDDWDVLTHTISSSIFWDMGSRWTLNPLIRYYAQNGASFYKAYNADDNTFNETDYGTSDQRLSTFDAFACALNIEKRVGHALAFNVSAAYQKQSFGLEMTWFSIGGSYAF